MDSSLQYGVSYIVRDPHEKNRLVAVRLTDVIRRGSLLQNGGGPINAEELKENTFGQFACDNGKVDKICAILHSVESKVSSGFVCEKPKFYRFGSWSQPSTTAWPRGLSSPSTPTTNAEGLPAHCLSTAWRSWRRLAARDL